MYLTVLQCEISGEQVDPRLLISDRELKKVGSHTEATQVAVETYVLRAKLEQLRALRGKLEIVGTEASDEADIREKMLRHLIPEEIRLMEVQDVEGYRKQLSTDETNLWQSEQVWDDE